MFFKSLKSQNLTVRIVYFRLKYWSLRGAVNFCTQKFLLIGRIGIFKLFICPLPGGIGRIAKFFDKMSRQFTFQEWKCIKEPDDEFDQLATFYRFWVPDFFFKIHSLKITFLVKDNPSLSVKIVITIKAFKYRCFNGQYSGKYHRNMEYNVL